MLLIIAEVGSTVIREIDFTAYPAQRTLAVWVQVGLALAVLLASLRMTIVFQPYEHVFQNNLESWLLASIALIVTLAGVYDELVRWAP